MAVVYMTCLGLEVVKALYVCTVVHSGFNEGFRLAGSIMWHVGEHDHGRILQQANSTVNPAVESIG